MSRIVLVGHIVVNHILGRQCGRPQEKENPEILELSVPQHCWQLAWGWTLQSIIIAFLELFLNQQMNFQYLSNLWLISGGYLASDKLRAISNELIRGKPFVINIWVGRTPRGPANGNLKVLITNLDKVKVGAAPALKPRSTAAKFHEAGRFGKWMEIWGSKRNKQDF